MQKPLLARLAVRAVVFTAVWLSFMTLMLGDWWKYVLGGDVRPVFLAIGIPLCLALILYLLEDLSLRGGK